MMAGRPNSLKQLWWRWKSLKLPWRKRFLVGFDLAGNTFWEFKDLLQAQRMRRIVKYPRSTHYGDVKVSPQWMQWLRHTREHPPSIHEQQLDITRQAQMKQLAAAADERWASLPSALDPPQKLQPFPEIASKDPLGTAQADPEYEPGVVDATGTTEEIAASRRGGAADKGSVKRAVKEKENPWKKQAQGNPGDTWQPQAWTPGAPSRKT